MRPAALEEFVGQEHLLGPGKILANALDSGHLPSLILWGPPGCGKTTLGRLLAERVKAQFVPISAVLSGVKDIREKVSQAADLRRMLNQQTVLFVDEIHRFNKAQQDALLPHVENGTITLVGATTENPSFEVNSALLSRCRTVVLEALGDDAIGRIVDHALSDETRGLGKLDLSLDDDAKAAILQAADGDARAALNTLELAADAIVARKKGSRAITRPDVEEAVQRHMVQYDKAGEQHYNTVSAFIKSMRGGDPDASLHYMIRMLEGGEDPLFVLRRIVIFASEDVGNADPQALQVALNATEAFRFIGMPEGVLPMTQAVLYLACAPKTNTALTSYAKARKDVLDHPNLPPPKHILNAPTKLMAELGHGRGYKYPHNFSGHYVAGEQYLPEKLRGRRYYEPSESGDEAETAARLRTWRSEDDA
ncbi:MAG: replication-associated recombination protein A [Bradymonadaceae bacterium]|nr:replication-associated recombination protein A [Lujinxingiaceae bacterium]